MELFVFANYSQNVESIVLVVDLVTHPQTLWKIQMQIQKWKQQKKKKLRYIP